jgi:pimeloyl-ACP methyl ester carboxylesterase
MLPEDEPAKVTALGFMKLWIDFANQTGTVLVAPAFDDADFGGRNGCPHGWGYRTLYGRHIGADEFVHEIIDTLQEQNRNYDGKFYLWGHSAGGQFVNHYVVRHPLRVHAAVISAPAWLAFPDEDVSWGKGMAPRHSVARWPGADEDQVLEINPDPKSFLLAAQLPLLVIVGEDDLEPLKHGPNQGGDTHVARAASWVRAMNEFAASQQRQGNVALRIVPGVAHRGGELARTSAPYLANHMRSNTAGRTSKRRPATAK